MHDDACMDAPASIQMCFEGVLHTQWRHSPSTALAAAWQCRGTSHRCNPTVPPQRRWEPRWLLATTGENDSQ